LLDYRKTKKALTAAEAQAADVATNLEEAIMQLSEPPKLT
jgi:hypothetical protein